MGGRARLAVNDVTVPCAVKVVKIFVGAAGGHEFILYLDRKYPFSFSGKRVDHGKITSEKGYNLITVDWDGGTLSVTDTDCGTSRECTMMDFKMGVIICSPHGLTVKALGEIPPPVVG